MSDLRKSWNHTFDNLRESFAGIEAHSERVIYGVELCTRLQNSLWDYVMNQGPRPVLELETAAYGQYAPLNGQEMPNIVEQQRTENRENGNGRPPPMFLHSPDEEVQEAVHLQSLADRIARGE